MKLQSLGFIADRGFTYINNHFTTCKYEYFEKLEVSAVTERGMKDLNILDRNKPVWVVTSRTIR